MTREELVHAIADYEHERVVADCSLAELEAIAVAKTAVAHSGDTAGRMYLTDEGIISRWREYAE